VFSFVGLRTVVTFQHQWSPVALEEILEHLGHLPSPRTPLRLPGELRAASEVIDGN